MAQEQGLVTPSVAAAATAASVALPPSSRTFKAAADASGSTVLTAPPKPMLVGTFAVCRPRSSEPDDPAEPARAGVVAAVSRAAVRTAVAPNRRGDRWV